jgi:hypothetical protein
LLFLGRLLSNSSWFFRRRGLHDRGRFFNRSWCCVCWSFLGSRFFGNLLEGYLFDYFRLRFRLSYRLWLWLSRCFFSRRFFGSLDRFGLRGSWFLGWCGFRLWFLRRFLRNHFLLCCWRSGFRLRCYRSLFWL